MLKINQNGSRNLEMDDGEEIDEMIDEDEEKQKSDEEAAFHQLYEIVQLMGGRGGGRERTRIRRFG